MVTWDWWFTFGVNIDIFPLDYFPKGLTESRRWSKRLQILKNIKTIKDLTLSKQRPFCKNVVILIGRFIFSVIPINWLVKKIDIYAQIHNAAVSGFVGNMTNGYGMKERVAIASSSVEVLFEGRKYNAVNNYDVYLKSLFGDYMQLPPVHERQPHHDFVAFFRD